MSVESPQVEQPKSAEQIDAAARNRTLMRAFCDEAFCCAVAERAARLQSLACSGKIAPDVVVHDPFMGTVCGAAAFVQLHLLFESAFCRDAITLHDINVADDFVSVFYTYSGRHTGRYIGLPATGKAVSLSCMELYRLHNGKIVEVWRQDIGAALLIQLGIVPSGYSVPQ